MVLILMSFMLLFGEPRAIGDSTELEDMLLTERARICPDKPISRCQSKSSCSCGLDECCYRDLISTHRNEHCTKLVPVHPTTYYVVNQCPAETNKSLADLCTGNMDNILPWPYYQAPAYSQSTKLLYKNLACASCNNDRADVVFNPSNIYCKNKITTNVKEITAINKANCIVDYPVYNWARMCATVETCPDGTREDWSRLCASFYTPVLVNDSTQLLVARNMFCGYCNGYSSSQMSCSLPKPDKLSIGRPFSFHYLFSVQITGKDWSWIQLTDIDGRSVMDDGSSKEPSKVYPVLDITSQILTSLSIVSLLLTAGTHICLKALHNIPGKLVLQLSLSFIFCHILSFIVQHIATNRSGLCTGVAALLLFFYTFSFLTMSCLACDTANTFSSLTKSLERTDSGKLDKFANLHLKYLVFCILCSTIWTGVVLTLNFTTTLIQFGNGNICWFGDPYGMIAMFLIPLTLIALMNGGLAIRTLVGLHRLLDGSSTLGPRPSLKRKRLLKECRIFLTLTVVTGSSWTLTGLAALVDTEVVWWLFVLCNASQGIFIFCSYCCKARILNLLKKDLFQWKSSSSPRNSIYSVSTATSTTFPII